MSPTRGKEIKLLRLKANDKIHPGKMTKTKNLNLIRIGLVIMWTITQTHPANRWCINALQLDLSASPKYPKRENRSYKSGKCKIICNHKNECLPRENVNKWQMIMWLTDYLKGKLDKKFQCGGGNAMTNKHIKGCSVSLSIQKSETYKKRLCWDTVIFIQ